jgi:hypothetical protein
VHDRLKKQVQSAYEKTSLDVSCGKPEFFVRQNQCYILDVPKLGLQHGSEVHFLNG